MIAPELKLGLIVANRDLRSEVQLCLQETPVRIVLDRENIQDWASFLEELDRLRPDVLLIDLAQLEKPFEDSLRRIKSTLAAPMVIALSTSTDPETILAAIRAGANEYLYPPLSAGLQRALLRIGADRLKQRGGAHASGKTLGFFSAKGGSGATTIATHVAVELQRITSQDVLLADFDIEMGLLGFLMKAKTPYSVLDAAKNTHRLDVSYWKALISNGRPNLEVIAAPGTAALREQVSPEQFRHVLRFTRSVYDWVVADLGRSLNLLNLNLLEDLDQAFLVATLDVLSLHQAKNTVQTLLNFGYSPKRLNLILNRMPKQPDLTPSEVQKVLGLPLYATLPNNYPELYEAYSEGTLLNAASDLGKHFTKIAHKIAGIPEEDKEKGKSKLSIFF